MEEAEHPSLLNSSEAWSSMSTQIPLKEMEDLCVQKSRLSEWRLVTDILIVYAAQPPLFIDTIRTHYIFFMLGK